MKYNVTPAMKLAGEKMAQVCWDAILTNMSSAKELGDFIDSVSDFERELVTDYMNDEITSTEAIYLAMENAKGTPSPKRRVVVMERWAQEYLVEAATDEEALEIVREGGGEINEAEGGFEYRDTLDSETWEVYIHVDDAEG